jgi:ElaB/YqjD/DUF883 family membrane-anchored ribosome-binding protein
MHSPLHGANGKEGLAHDLRHLVDEADQFLKAAAQSGDEPIDGVRQQFVEQLRQMRAQLDELEDSTMHKARHAVRRADHAVHEPPYGAIGIAAAAGLLIGFLAARR